MFVFFTDKPSNVILVANPTENVNCSDFLLVNFTCEAADANPPVENYQLLKSQEFVDTGSNGMWIKNITKKGGHFYSCKALHPLGNVTSPDVTVTFNGKFNGMKNKILLLSSCKVY